MSDMENIIVEEESIYNLKYMTGIKIRELQCKSILFVAYQFSNTNLIFHKEIVGFNHSGRAFIKHITPCLSFDSLK